MMGANQVGQKIGLVDVHWYLTRSGGHPCLGRRRQGDDNVGYYGAGI